jgi:hypothetical protein
MILVEQWMLRLLSLLFEQTKGILWGEFAKSAHDGFQQKFITQETTVLSQGLSFFQNQQGEFG